MNKLSAILCWMLLAACVAAHAQEVLSISPDGQTTILKLARDNERFDLALQSAGLPPRILMEGLDGTPAAEPSVDVTWHNGSAAVEVTAATYTHTQTIVLIKRIEEEPKLPVWQELEIPDLRSLIAENTREPATVFGEGSHFLAGGPGFLPSSGKVSRLTFYYAEMDGGGNVGDKSLKYILEFTTTDWRHYELKRITRSGDVPSQGMLSAGDSQRWVELYPRERVLPDAETP